jgi:hypothetical protein
MAVTQRSSIIHAQLGSPRMKAEGKLFEARNIRRRDCNLDHTRRGDFKVAFVKHADTKI